jgi:hypothetical protein
MCYVLALQFMRDANCRRRQRLRERYRANVKDPPQQISFNVDYLVFSFVGRTITVTKVLTKPVIATITEAIPAMDTEVKIATARIISPGLSPFRIQVDGLSTDVGEAGINCEWVV